MSDCAQEVKIELQNRGHSSSGAERLVQRYRAVLRLHELTPADMAAVMDAKDEQLTRYTVQTFHRRPWPFRRPRMTTFGGFIDKEEALALARENMAKTSHWAGDVVAVRVVDDSGREVYISSR